MIPENIQKKVEKILKNENYSESDGDEIIIKQKEDGLFYAFVESKKRGSFGQMVIDAGDLSFLWGNSSMNPSTLLERFKSGARSMPHQSKTTRRNVRLPVIEDNEEILDFSKKLANTFIELFDEEDSDYVDPLNGEWYKFIYNALVLLLSAKEPGTKLLLLTMVYVRPSLVKSYLKNVMDRDVYDYWTTEVPQFMEQENAKNMVDCFNIRIASLIGEQEIQDLCNNYKS